VDGQPIARGERDDRSVIRAECDGEVGGFPPQLSRPQVVRDAPPGAAIAERRGFESPRVEVMPPHANHRVTVAGPRLCFRDRSYGARTCRDEALDAIVNLVGRTGIDQVTTRQVAEEMGTTGTSYARSMIAKTLRRMSGRGERAYEHLELEPVARGRFRLRRS